MLSNIHGFINQLDLSVPPGHLLTRITTTISSSTVEIILATPVNIYDEEKQQAVGPSRSSVARTLSAEKKMKLALPTLQPGRRKRSAFLLWALLQSASARRLRGKKTVKEE
ncbi:hypothetical protein MHYP_G00118280 [Metynnis hypsauchen]